MTDKPVLFVAGFGRCGTTMMMTMLDRAGFPVAGRRPAYETDEMMPLAVDHAWVREQAGKAVKWISPLDAVISPSDLLVRPVIIHMDRDTREMARSQIKMVQMMFPSLGLDDVPRSMQAALEHGKPLLWRTLNELGTTYSFTFEFVIRDPEMAARKLAAIIKHEFGQEIDIAAAASVPVKRSVECAPDMSFEASML